MDSKVSWNPSVILHVVGVAALSVGTTTDVNPSIEKSSNFATVRSNLSSLGTVSLGAGQIGYLYAPVMEEARNASWVTEKS